MADMFSTYEDEFLGLKKMIHDFIDSIPSATGDARKREIGDAKDLVDQAKDLVKHNKLTHKPLPIHFFTFLQLEKMEFDDSHEDKVEGYKKELAGLEGLLKKAIAKSDYNVEHESLIGGSQLSSDLAVNSRDHQDRYRNTTAQMSSQSSMIQDSLRTTEETIGVAEISMTELQRQSDVIGHSRSRINDTDDNLNKGNRILRTMARRAVTNKLIMIFIIFLLLCGIAIVVWLVWFPPWKNTNGSD